MTIDKIIEEFRDRFCFKTEILNKKDHKTEIVSYNSDFGFRDFENWLRNKLVEVKKEIYLYIIKENFDAKNLNENAIKKFYFTDEELIKRKQIIACFKNQIIMCKQKLKELENDTNNTNNTR